MEHLLMPYTAVTRVGRGAALVLAPHPDDEVLGCGGAILRHVAAGDPVRVVIVTDGGHREDAGTGLDAYIVQRQQESRDAAALLGYGTPIFWSLPDRGIAYGEELVSRLVATILSVEADLVYAPSLVELHPDHRTLGMAVAEAVRRSGRPGRLLFYEVSAPLHPNVLLDISDLVAQKHAAIACFASQLERQRYDEHILALNRFRTYTLPKEVMAAEGYLAVTAEDLRHDPCGLYEAEFQRQQRLGLTFEPVRGPLVSVIIRSIGRESVLREALDSVALQTYPNIEVVVVNAKGSGHPDLGSWCGRFPLRLVGRDHALSRSTAANVGLDEAKGDCLIFLDDDDWFLPDHVAGLVRTLADHPEARVAYAGVQAVAGAESGRTGEPRVFNEPYDAARLGGGNYIPINAVLFDRTLVTAGCRFDERLDVYEDWDYWLQISRLTTFVHCDRVSARYRASGTSGVGLLPDPEKSRRSRVVIFEKWRHLWSGEDVAAFLASADERAQTRLEQQQRMLADSQAQIRALEEGRSGLGRACEALEEALRTKGAHIEALEGTVTRLEAALTDSARERQRSDQEIERLTAEATQLRLTLRAIEGSRAWRLVTRYWAVRASVLAALGFAPASAGHPHRVRRLLRALRELVLRAGGDCTHLYALRAERVASAIPAAEQPVRWLESVEIGGRRKTGLFMHPDSSAVFRLVVEPRSVFRAFIALQPEAWAHNAGGVRFSAEIRAPAGGALARGEHTIDPGRRGRDRCWRELRLDLRRFAGTEIELALATCVATGGGPNFAWAVWGDPAIFSRRHAAIPVVLRAASRILRAALRGDLGAELRRIVRSAERLSPHAHRRRRGPADRARSRDAAQSLPVQPAVSLLIPARGAPDALLVRSLESVLAQDDDRWEVWICAAGRDDTEAATAAARHVADARIEILTSEVGRGLADSLNGALERARGDFVAVMTAGDQLAPDALSAMVAALASTGMADIVYSDEAVTNDFGEWGEPLRKPGWAPELILSYPYVGRLCMLRREMVARLGGWREECVAAEEYDLVLRAVATGARVMHVAQVLCYRRREDGVEGDVFGTAAALAARRRALEDYVLASGLSAEVVDAPAPVNLRVRHRIRGNPLVSIIIPTRDRLELLRQCIASIESRTTYSPFEVVVVDNDSAEPQTREYLAACRHRVVPHPGPFNFSAVNNTGARAARGDYLLFLNNDTEVLTGEWLSAMLEWAQQPPIGCVGAKLLFPDGTFQHVGVGLRGGFAHHPFYGQRPGEGNRWTDTELVRNWTAVTAACLMIRRGLFEEVGRLNESFPVNYNDVDLCLRVVRRGYRNVYTPFAVLYHYESSSRPAGVVPSEEQHLRNVHADLLADEVDDPLWPGTEPRFESAV